MDRFKEIFDDYDRVREQRPSHDVLMKIKAIIQRAAAIGVSQASIEDMQEHYEIVRDQLNST